jgi:hypothetical protein
MGGGFFKKGKKFIKKTGKAIDKHGIQPVIKPVKKPAKKTIAFLEQHGGSNYPKPAYTVGTNRGAGTQNWRMGI